MKNRKQFHCKIFLIISIPELKYGDHQSVVLLKETLIGWNHFGISEIMKDGKIPHQLATKNILNLKENTKVKLGNSGKKKKWMPINLLFSKKEKTFQKKLPIAETQYNIESLLTLETLLNEIKLCLFSF